MLQYAAEMGNDLACAALFEEVSMSDNEKAFQLAQYAASQNERDGFFWLGHCFLDGIGCEKDLHLAKENYLIAAELGHVSAACGLALLLGASNPDHWIWLGRAALHGGSNWNFRDLFLLSFAKHINDESSLVVFAIGRALKGNIDVEKKEIFGPLDFNWDSDFHIGHANRMVSFYESQLESARLAVNTWTLVSTSLHMIKDMRIYIGKMIWEARFEANYKI